MSSFDKIPSLEESKIMLNEAQKLSPTPWVEHSLNVAEAAKLIAEQIPGMDNDYSIPRWKSTFEIKRYFESKMGKSMYDILPGVVENTF